MSRVAFAAVLIIAALCTPTQAQDWRMPGDWQEGPGAMSLATPAVSLSGMWRLELDDTPDGDLQPTTTRKLKLESAAGRLIGTFQDEQTEGVFDRSVFSGEVIPGSTAIVSLRQDRELMIEGAYSRPPAPHTTIYTGQLVSEGIIAGTYWDNHGGRGDWSLKLISEVVFEPATTDIPNEPLYESVLGTYGQAIRGERHRYINLRPPARNLWDESVQETVGETLTYGDVDYIGTAKLVIHEAALHTIDVPGAGVEVRLNGQLVQAGDVELDAGVYDVEIYTNHWGQPYLTYAEVHVLKQGTEERIPFVNTESDIKEFKSRKVNGRPVQEASKYEPRRVDPLRK